ncbi:MULTISPECIES: hypothetical protein [unclassified Polynucleobacter]|jgi:hypothetical protein|uniref:hypothetical protein n=1 Tax=unclassified Polynucleobacter TaxID=2640945 RepID=UPI000BD7B147|nr:MULTISPECIES: hypothetical protein [unclassified Polynucleobacter]OYY21409.1 MAG: hypothetical protein B7Y67_02045 [Polynucleobacter sp. 35-46-11]OZA78192.1 MAG: hypothetical protein B7X71_02110 [Polynucleobacter sp. 39-46-10]
MRDAVKNLITLIGNEKITWLAKEMQERLERQHEENDALYDYTSVGKVLYGRANDKAELGEEEIGADWICLAEEFGEDDLRFETCGNPPYKFQDYILSHAVKLDPNVIIGMVYEHENEYFIGARYIAFKDGAICSSEERLDTYNYRVVSEYELEEVAEELKENESDDVLMSFDDYWSIQEQQSKIALSDLKDLLKNK